MILVTTLSPSDQSVGMVVRGRMIYLIGTVTGVVSTDGFVQALDSAGVVRWTLPLDNGSNEIATAAAFDPAGNIWIAGSAQSTSASPTPSVSPSPTASTLSPTPSPTSTVLNPDAVTLDPTVPMREDLTSLTLWKVSPAGVLLASYRTELSVPFLVRGMGFSHNAIAAVGIISTASGHAGFLIQADLNGNFDKPLIVGNTNTELNAVVKKNDGSLVLLGESSETLVKQTVKGLRDGIIVSVAKTGKILRVIRSSDAKSTRAWQSGTNSFFLGGDSVIGAKTQAVVTKFGSTLAPAWTARFASTGPALTADGPTTRFMTFSSSGPILGIKGWKPTRNSVLTLSLDARGVLKGAYGASLMATPMAIGYSRELGVVVLGRGPTGVSIFHALPR